jgi:hypothetical protein
MNIGFIANHACVRCDKMAMPLLEKGHKVHMISHKDPAYFPHYTTRAKWEDLGQLIEAVKLYSREVDIFHAHNEPSWFISVVKEHCDVPVILDVHDSFLSRSTPDEAEKRLEDGHNHIRVTAEERNNFQLADGLVFPGQVFGDLVCNEFKLTQPRLTLPSYCTKRMQAYTCQEWLGGLVYEGRVDLAEENAKHPQAYGFRYCDYEEMAERCHGMGMDFHLYARADEPFKKIYEPIAFPHLPQPFQKLIMSLSRHDWGLVGNITETPQWNIAFPNKMFEYISAGVPVAALNAEASGVFLESQGLGISVKTLDELAARWGEHTEIRKVVLKKRQQFVMESHIQDLEQFYEEVLNGR